MKTTLNYYLVGATGISVFVMNLSVYLDFAGYPCRGELWLLERSWVLISIAIIICLIIHTYWLLKRNLKKDVWVVWGMCLLVEFLGIVISILLATALTFLDIDHFADDLRPPDEVVLALPVPYTNDATLNSRESRFDGMAGDILLYRRHQGGLYAADVWCNPGEAGQVYLRAFEITRGDELSSSALRERTEQLAKFDSKEGRPFLHRMDFTIYEGNWGQYYGARFEVWFKPSNGTPERKLLEKNYKIDGWMR